MNALSQKKKEEILMLVKLGYSFREVSKRLCVKRHTVSQYAKANGIVPQKGRHGGLVTLAQIRILVQS